MRNFHPLVSIVIPVYNGSNYIQSAIDSALGQDYDNIEVIVVNDGSTDNTDEIIKNYGNKITYYLKENGGVSTALNLGIRSAHGEYISWLSHDDYYLPNKVSRQIEELNKLDNQEKIIVFSDFIARYIKNNSYSDIEKKIPFNTPNFSQLSKISSLKLLFARSIHGCSLLIPKIAFESIGCFNEKLLTTQDYDLWFKFIESEYSFFYIPEILLVSRQHEQQVSKLKLKIAKKEKKILFSSAYRNFKRVIKKEEITYFKNSLNENKLFYILLKKIKQIIVK